MKSPDQAQVIVIGSGFGGAVVAARLAEAGIATLVLERGPWRDTVPVRSMGIAERAPLPQGRRVWTHLVRSLRNTRLPRGGLTLNARGLFELHFGPGLNIVCSSGVGGGSHVYSGLNERPCDPRYWDGIAEGLSAAGMEVHYRRVLARMGSRTPLADDQLPNTLHERFQAHPALATAGVDYALTMGFLFPQQPGQPRRLINEDGVERFETTPGADGNLGSPQGGKTTLDVAYLARALRHGLRVCDLHEVTGIVRDVTTGGFSVDVIDHRQRRRVRHAAAQVVLAAGTLNTLRLLLASREAGGLDGMPRLGERFGGNGDFFGYWDLNDTMRDLTQAMPAHGYLRLREPGDAGWPALLEGSLPPPGALPLGSWLARKLRHGSLLAAMGEDAQDGVATWRRGRLRIDYRPDASPIYARIRQAFGRLGEVTGRKVYHFQRPITVHPMGGACIGRDRDDGVVDAHGEVFDVPGLYVADASALPKPVGAPPSLSIAAWAEHVAAGLVARFDRTSTSNTKEGA